MCRDPELAQRAHEFHFIGLVRDPDRFAITDEGPWHQEVHEFGLNYRLTDIASALGPRPAAPPGGVQAAPGRDHRALQRQRSPQSRALRTPTQRA